MITRRPFLKLLGGSFAGAFSFPGVAEDRGEFPIGACDWSIGKKQDPAAFDVAGKIGLEGLQVSFSTPGSDFDLRDRSVREQYYQRVEETGIRLASLGMGVLNQRPLATDPDAISWVSEAIDVMTAMEKERPEMATNICLLAFFGKGDINGRPELFDAVVKKLRTVAGKAEDRGIVLGIESLLSADDHLRLMEAVESDSIQVYYDSANSDRMGYDIYEEVIRIGGDRICEVHCKENGALLGEGKVDFERFRDSLVTAGYRDWLIIEGGMEKNADPVDAYARNFRYLDRVFRKG